MTALSLYSGGCDGLALAAVATAEECSAIERVRESYKLNCCKNGNS